MVQGTSGVNNLPAVRFTGLRSLATKAEECLLRLNYPEAKPHDVTKAASFMVKIGPKLAVRTLLSSVIGGISGFYLGKVLKAQKPFNWCLAGYAGANVLHGAYMFFFSKEMSVLFKLRRRLSSPPNPVLKAPQSRRIPLTVIPNQPEIDEAF